ncbi:hypothetical protein ACFQY5_04915 [Paeniroseomonas aquatica]|uniref:hypothetical protein n=1 Tax=Paeniroseomonas aquatica TaxID=373043 RepID=UPI003622327A
MTASHPPRPAATRAPPWAMLALPLAGLVAAPLLAVLVAAAVPAGAVWRHIASTTLAEMLANRPCWRCWSGC